MRRWPLRKLAALFAAVALAVLLLRLPHDGSARAPRAGAEAPEAAEAVEAKGGGAPKGPSPAAWPDRPAAAARGAMSAFGTVVTEEGAPVEGAEVRALLPDGPATTTGSDGTYALTGLRMGSLPLRASARGYAARVQQTEVALPETRVDFVLRRAAPIVGRVVDQSGLPVQGARLRLASASENVRIEEEHETGEDGEFRFEDAYEGRWWLLLRPARAGDFEGMREILVSPSEGPLELGVRRPGAAGVDLFFEVVDARSGEPLSIGHASVERDERAAMSLPQAVETGRGMVVARGVPPGRWRLTIISPHSRVTRVVDAVAGAGEVRRRIAVAPPGSIVGRADLSGVAAPGRLDLRTHPPGQGRFASARHAEQRFERGCASLDAIDGYAFRLDDVPAEMPIDLVVSAEDMLGRARVTVEGGGVAQVTVRMRKAGTLDLRVSNPPPVRRFVIEYRPEGEADWPDWRYHGHAEVSERIVLPAGPVRWSVRWPDPRSGEPVVREGDVTVKAGAVTVVEVDLR